MHLFQQMQQIRPAGGGFVRGFEFWGRLSGAVPLVGISSGRCFAGNAAILAGAADASGPVAALLADVPCATPETLALALTACTDGPAIVSDAEGIGTTFLGAPRATDLHPCFGPRSRAAHVAAGARDITDPTPGALAGLRRDVDCEVDLWDARRIGLGAFTRAIVDRA